MAQNVPEVEPAGGGAPTIEPGGAEVVSAADAASGPGVDPRVERTRARAIGAALELFREGGWDAVTHLAVSERSGIGRTTLYRHWPDAASLLKELVVLKASTDPGTFTGELRHDLLAALERLRRNLLDPATERAMLTVMERAAVDATYAGLRLAITKECSRQLTALVRAAAGGDLLDCVDAEEALAELAGPLVFRRLFCRSDLPRAFVARVVDDFLAAHRPR